MATWVTHLLIADILLEKYPCLHRRGFSVGNIAPDCNVENDDWTSYTPPKEVTHRMTGAKKTVSDADGFAEEYIVDRHDRSGEEYSFLLGYYAHLLADSLYSDFVRGTERVEAQWKRVCEALDLSDTDIREKTWDSLKQIVPKEVRLREIHTLEAVHLEKNPDSAYLTEIIPLGDFPDYLEFMPGKNILRKIGIMGYIPAVTTDPAEHLFLTDEEYSLYISATADMIAGRFLRMGLLNDKT